MQPVSRRRVHARKGGSEMIAVVGATGNTGRAVVDELTQLGHAPICVVRNADMARQVLGEKAKTAVAELSDRSALEEA
jgi:NAD(P)H dehydrogenase (quinone)